MYVNSLAHLAHSKGLIDVSFDHIDSLTEQSSCSVKHSVTQTVLYKGNGHIDGFKRISFWILNFRRSCC